MISIRNYKDSDYGMVKAWWDEHKEAAPLPHMLPTESTYVYELDGIPALCVTMYLLNTKAFAMVDNFVGNPAIEKSKRQVVSREGFPFLLRRAKELGIERLFCMGHRAKLKLYYESLGFSRTLTDVDTFILEVK